MALARGAGGLGELPQLKSGGCMGTTSEVGREERSRELKSLNIKFWGETNLQKLATPPAPALAGTGGLRVTQLESQTRGEGEICCWLLAPNKRHRLDKD